MYESVTDRTYDQGIDVVVVNYRTPNLVKDFVDSYLFQTSKVPSSLIVVDVDPTEDSYEEIKNIMSSYDFEYQFWPIDYNCGYSGACNFASTVSDREVIAFFNSDTRLFDDTLDICYDYLMANDDVAICGPLQVDSGGLVKHAGIFGTNSKPDWRGAWNSKSPSRFRDVRDDAVTVMGSAYFVKRAVWDELASDPDFVDMYPDVEGAFLPTPHYYEETWCSYFARHKGWKVAYVGTAMMIHDWHKSSPLGSVEGEIMDRSREMFRQACDRLGIEHD
jgi:GT2 family glycosyltransferase